MAHEVEQMFFMGETPWHGLGIPIQKALSIDEAILAAGLDWSVSLQPLDAQISDPSGAFVKTQRVTHKALVRDDRNEILGVVGPGYFPLQNEDALGFFRSFVKSGELAIHTAGSLRGGQRVWALAKMNRDPMIIRGDDTVEKYVLLSNAHDGTMAVRAGFTPIRVVCANTLAMALDEGQSQLIRIKHSSRIVENLEAVSDIMNLADQKFEATAEQYRFLASRQVHQGDLEKYVSIVMKQQLGSLAAIKASLRAIGAKAVTERDAEEEQKKRISKVTTSVIRLFETGKGHELPGAKGTYWGAYNAFTEYLSYERGHDHHVRLDSLWFGSAKNLNRRALETASLMVTAA